MRLPRFKSSSNTDHLALTTDEQTAVTEFLQRLVQTPSSSTQEQKVAQLIVDELKQVGVQDIQIDQIGNVIARIGNGDGPTLLINAHMDTVDATDETWQFPPYEAIVQSGVLYGLGVADMKGSIAAMVYAAKRLIETDTALKGNLVMVFVVQQEPCEGCSLKELLNNEGIQPDWVLLGEPTNLGLHYGQRGRVLFKVTVQGKSSHASNPVLGQNAIFAASRLIFGIDLLSADLTTDPFLGPGTVTVTHIESTAPSKNAIPNSCTFFVDRRLTLGETPARAQSQIEAITQREELAATINIVEYEADSYTGYTIHSREAYHPWAMDENHPLVQQVSAAIQSVTGRSPRLGHWPFSTAGAYTMAGANIPTVGFGPGDHNLVHMPDEHVKLEDVFTAARTYAVITSSLLSGNS